MQVDEVITNQLISKLLQIIMYITLINYYSFHPGKSTRPTTLHNVLPTNLVDLHFGTVLIVLNVLNNVSTTPCMNTAASHIMFIYIFQ